MRVLEPSVGILSILCMFGFSIGFCLVGWVFKEIMAVNVFLQLLGAFSFGWSAAVSFYSR
ncbi:MAG: hypothetical protein ACXAEU_23850 [Candidatus Hodarchaeales archaeon]|jgi:hypothetical protein